MPDGTEVQDDIAEEILARDFEGEVSVIIGTMKATDVAPMKSCGRLGLEVVRVNTPSYREMENDGAFSMISASKVFGGNYVVCIRRQKV